MIGELVPIVATFLIVNVILLIRAGARGQLSRLGAPVMGPQPALQVAAAVAAEPVPAASLEPPVAEVPGSRMADDEPAPEAAPDQRDPVEALTRGDRDPVTELDDEATWDRRIADESARARRHQRPVAIRLELEGLDGPPDLLGEEARDRLLRALADTLRPLARDSVATSGLIDPGDSQRLATEPIDGGRPSDAPHGGTVAVPGSATPAAPRPPVTYVSCAPTPRRAWDRCREPNCDHKKDHRRDRRR